MEYYNPIDNSSKRYAAIITVVVLALIALAVSYITIEVELQRSDVYAVEIEYLEPEEPPVEEPKRVVSQVEAKVVNPRPQPKQANENPAPKQTFNQTSGQAEATQTINQNALFKPSAGTTPDSDITEGNRLAPEGDKEEHKGEGTGLNIIGDVDFDGGLQGRVLAGYPHPKGNNAMGKVVVAVVVDSDGKVVSATIKAQGTTTTDTELRNNAINAAKRTKFKPDAERMTQSGTITYNYKVK